MVGFPDGSVVTNLPAMQDSWAHPLIGKFSEEEIATHSSILAWRIPWTEEPGRLQFMGLQTDMTEQLTLTLQYDIEKGDEKGHP